jgi:NAD(P)H-dependent FMN reductase
MPIPIDFDRDKGKRILAAVASGEPITGIRNVNDMLACAGACFFAAMSHGAELQKNLTEQQHPEHQEASEESLFRDLYAAVQFYSQLFMWLHDGEYDRRFASKVKAVVWESPDGLQVRPVAGFKGE